MASIIEQMKQPYEQYNRAMVNIMGYMDRQRVKKIECLHDWHYDYSTPMGDWFVCYKCGVKELREYKYS